MAYTNNWTTVAPAGSAAANTADDEIRKLRLDMEERLEEVVIEDMTTDPVVHKAIAVSLIDGTPDLAVVYTNALFALPTGGITTIDFVGETLDTGSFHDNSSNPSRLTITTAAYYRLSCRMYATSGASAYSASMHLRKNGSTIASVQKNWNGTRLVENMWLSYIDLAAATDYYEIAFNNNSGDAWTTLDISNKAYFMIERLAGTT